MVNINLPHIGFLLTTYNDLELSRSVYDSLVNSIPSGVVWSFIVIDAGSKDGSAEFWSSHTFVISPNTDITFKKLIDSGDLKHLSVSLNTGIDYLLMKGVEYIAWIHADMQFPQEGWAHNLVKRMQEDLKIAKISPNLSHQKHIEERPGNSCPWVMPSSVLKTLPSLREKFHGEECQACCRNHTCSKIFCEKFINIGGYEDWDLNRILVQEGFKVIVSSTAWVEHEGMGTRKKKDTSKDQFFNADVYSQRYKTGKPVV